jgi:hypothetical protein
MLNTLSAKYNKEIALSFLSLFFIAGIGMLKAQASQNQFFVQEFDYPSAKSKIADDKISHFSEYAYGGNINASSKNSMWRDRELALGVNNTTVKRLNSLIENVVLKKIPANQPGKANQLLIGGPGQPEMSAFKSIGADNMTDPFSGDFSYNIPLLDVGGYPVNMFYNSGITMDQDASWLGLGWNINPGTIMRNMRGIPDDFNGKDLITKRQSTRPDKTWGVSAGAGIKLAGYPLGAGMDVNAGLSFNNKLGLALEAGIHPSLSISKNAQDDKTVSLSFGANLSVNSRSGASLTPSINVGLADKISETESRSGSLGLSFTQTSRAGITGLHLDASLSKSKDLDKYSSSGFYKYKSTSGTEAALSSSISFAYPTVVPSIKTVFTRRSYNLSFSVGGEFYGFNGHGRLAGYSTESWIADKDKETTHQAYGMLNYQKANDNPNAILDFNRANDGVYTPNSPAIAMPVYTYDVFSINGEGTGGSFRATRNDLGYMRDAHIKTRDDAGSLGLDLGFGNTVHGGAEFSYANSPSEVGGWNANNLAKSVFQFQENDGEKERVYFKNPGEKTIPDAAYQTTIGGENLVRLKMSGNGSGAPMLLPKLVKYDVGKNVIGEKELTISSVIKQGRDKRSQVISFLTAEEADRIGFNKMLYSYNPDTTKIIFGAACNKTGIDSFKRYVGDQPLPGDRKAHHISEIDVLGTDGRKYVYGIPVYNTRQVDVSFSVNEGDGNSITGKSEYAPGVDDTKDNTKGRDWYMNQEEMPAYTHSFLLSALVSPNYVDVTGDGVTEDDMGDAVKFNYSKSADLYKWRTPIGKTGDRSNASYSEGLKTDNKDDKAHYVYGEREMWYLYTIESKNMVARFFTTTDREDGKQVLGQNGGIDIGKGMQKLNKICLYSKGDLMKENKGGAKAKPIKTVRFFQSYKLCKNVESSTPGNGKLTLDSIWISYNSNQSKPKSRYVFSYPVDKNPDYEYNSNDRWGNYKPADNALNNNPVGLNNADYPYSIQDKIKADKYAASWVMNKILLPSGGIINVDFESDDYAYVQNRKAANMFSILGFGVKYNPVGSEKNNPFLFPAKGKGEECKYIYVQLSYPVTSTDITEQQRELAARYFENTSQLFMKIAVKMPSDPGIAGSELIPVYADIDNFGIVPGSGGSIAYIKVKTVTGGSTPMVQQALQFIKQQLPGKAYPGYDVKDNSTGKAIVIALAGMITSVAALAMGDDATLKFNNKCREVETAKSFVRLTNPYLTKYGGGLRVKRVTINDNWNKMTGQYESSYGQEYKYTTQELINGKLNTISSGVASWEPSMGGDENPHKEIMRYMNHNRGGPNDFGAIEMPLGEMFYPSPMVGYSRVEVLSINRDTVKNLPTRQVTEFYTTKDFPFQSSCTQLSDPEANVKYEPRPILQLLKLNMKKSITQSQGFLVDMNDMNGKVKIQATYSALDPVNAVSFTQNFYNVERATDKTYKFNHTFSTINKPDGVVDNNSLIGRDIELMADFRQHTTETVTTNISVNFDFFFLGIFPIPLTNLLQPTIYEGTTYRSASLLKIVNHYGMLDSVVVIDKGSMVSTKNMVYDAETGNPILTRTNNEHNKPLYNFSYPAHWAYSGMGPAYKNIDANYSGLTFRNGKLETPISMNVFESGDELYVIAKNDRGPDFQYPCDGVSPGKLAKNNENKIWAVNTGKGGSLTPQFVFMDQYGNPYSATDVKMRIVRSGHRNMLDQTVGSITSLKSPVNTITGQLEFIDATNIIQTSAATFKDHWKVDNSFYLKDSVVTQSRWAPVRHGTIYSTKSYSVGMYRYSCNKCDYQSKQFINPEYLLARKQSFGTSSSNSRKKQKSWLLFDFDNTYSTPLNSSTEIISAKLNLASHSSDGLPVQHNFSYTNSHGNSDNLGHVNENPHAYANASKNNNFKINRIIGQWSADNSADWVDKHFNGYEFSNIGNQVVASGTQPFMSSSKNYTGENSIEFTSVFKDMLKDKFDITKQYSTGIKLSMLNDEDFRRDDRVCFQTRLTGNGKYNIQPYIDITYYSCDEAYPLGYIPSANENVIKCGSIASKTSFCLSKFTKKAINPYVEGILGNWRVDTAFVYYGERKEQDAGIGIDTRTAGTIINFQKFWNPDLNYLQRNTIAAAVWVWNSTITQYNRKGYEIENKDPLGRFNSGLYGYNQQLPVAIANNARVREIMFDGFEDYDYQTAFDCLSCKPHRHANFSEIGNYLDTMQHHTGRYSLRVGGGMAIDLKAPVTDNVLPDKGYGLRIKVDSTSYTDTLVILKGGGFRGKYYNCNSNKNNCSIASSSATTVLLNDVNATVRQNEQINNNFISLPPGINSDGFTIRWEGYVQPIVSGYYSFQLSADDGFNFKIADNSGNTILATTTRWDCNWGSSKIVTSSQPLVKGKLYKITTDYFENKERQFMQLVWKTPGSSSWENIPVSQVYSPESLSLSNNTVSYVTTWCTKLDSVQVRGNAITDTFSLIQNKKMVLSAWVKEKQNGADNCKCSAYVKNAVIIFYTGNTQTETLSPTGNIIEGWQRYESVFTIPGNATQINVSLKNLNALNGGDTIYFDDLRIHPFNANLKSFVYHSSNLRLMAELDENNYASFYEYDDDGTLTRVKKETINGIKTITETRSSMQKAIKSLQ